ncbi:MAG: sigma factor-like helix-turn-helix DNA-binding protein [Actinomycetota bacterium]
MVVNLSRSALRHRRVASRYAERSATSEPSEDDSVAAMAEREAAVAALRRLPRRQRECVVLRYYLDMAEADVAATLGSRRGP